ncbi:bicaudal D-related protein homolog [Procambarus clarkii]|uniref:bicaudal D-related protein homolog n=1 Tax=Procambarus clarkii TaxID=6728 RepID=UPI003742CED7
MPVSYQRRGGGELGLLERSAVALVGDQWHTDGEGMPGDAKYELEDYVYEMECRAGEMARSEEAEDIHARLAQKERDLILAAELGKALLERNELLVQQNERLAEDYSHKLEGFGNNYQRSSAPISTSQDNKHLKPCLSQH